MIYDVAWGYDTTVVEASRKKCRLAEEHDEFCADCRKQWENRHRWNGVLVALHPKTVNPYCHVCGAQYEAHDILLAQPITIVAENWSGKITEKCSICCRECYDAIVLMLRAINGK
jgi:hypothetical protein